jgi:hypothetical protein
MRVALVSKRGNDAFNKKVAIGVILLAFESPYTSKIKINTDKQNTKHFTIK